MPFKDKPKALPQVILFIAIGLLALLVNAWVSFHALNTLTSNAQLRKQAKEAIESVDEILISLLNIETGKRGYVLTGDNSYLQPFDHGIANIEAEMVILSRSISQIPGLELELKQIIDQSHALISQAQKLRKIREQHGLQKALLEIKKNEGKALMDAARLTCSEIRARANARLITLRKADIDNIRNTKLSLLFLTVLDALLFSLAFALLFRTLYANSRMYLELKHNSEELQKAHKDLSVSANVLRLKQQALKFSEEQFRSSFETAAIGMALVGLDGKWLKVNKSLCTLLGREESELLTTTFQELTHPDDLSLDLAYVQDLLEKKREHYQIEKRYFHKNEQIIWVNLSVSIVRDEEGNPIHFVSQIEDITLRKSYQEELQNYAHLDTLTGLPNRRILMSKLEYALSLAREQAHVMAVLFIDVDYFKSINDTYGHDFGDKVLIEVSQRVLSCIRDTDTIGRQGGDEFLVILSNINKEADVSGIINKIEARFTSPMVIEGVSIKVSLSIGAAIYNKSSNPSPTQLLKNADIALYEVKGRGRNSYEIYKA